MDKETIKYISIIFLIILTALFYFSLLWAIDDKEMKRFSSLSNDLNILKSNDLGFANYIQANANTLTYINENCKVTKDTNEITELTCIKSKTR
jgi:hypothetical protein